jgi:hypothetical protein
LPNSARTSNGAAGGSGRMLASAGAIGDAASAGAKPAPGAMGTDVNTASAGVMREAAGADADPAAAAAAAAAAADAASAAEVAGPAARAPRPRGDGACDRAAAIANSTSSGVTSLSS